MSELDKVMEEYRASLESANNTLEEDKISSDFEGRIDEAFKSDQIEIDKIFSSQQEILDKETLEYFKFLKDQEEESEKNLPEENKNKYNVEKDVFVLSKKEFADKSF